MMRGFGRFLLLLLIITLLYLISRLITAASAVDDVVGFYLHPKHAIRVISFLIVSNTSEF